MQLHNFLIPMAMGILCGLLSRVLLIKTSYRQFPSKPHGLIIHIFLGFVASLLGALIIPAVMKPDFTAGVFISIGTAQFHSIRGLEREAWKNIDKGELVERGPAYIEGMAVSFESRIFMVIGVSALTTLASYFFSWPIGLICGVILALVIRFWRQGKRVTDMADVKSGTVSIDVHRLSVDGLELQTFSERSGMEGAHDLQASDLLSVVVHPRDFAGILTFAHHGQQQAMLHNLSIAVGVQMHPHIKPTATYFPKDRKLIFVILPLLPDMRTAVEAVSGAPILESVIRRPIT